MIPFFLQQDRGAEAKRQREPSEIDADGAEPGPCKRRRTSDTENPKPPVVLITDEEKVFVDGNPRNRSDTGEVYASDEEIHRR